MSCKCPDRGCFVYYSPKCEEYCEISLGCNSTAYARIAISGTQQWAKTLSRKMFNVSHRHAVMTFPDKSRPLLKEERRLWKVVMDSAIKALNATLA